MFFIDISEECGYKISEQIDLFNNIKPLFKNKPLIIVLTKIDLKKFEDLPKEKKKLIDDLKNTENVTVL